MSFSVAFWNIENFHGGEISRSNQVADHIRSLNANSEEYPDLIALCEVKDKTLMRTFISQHFADYDFAMSDTAMNPRGGVWKSQIELLIGWKRGSFNQVMYTQRIEITAGRLFSVRPGVLVNVKKEEHWYSVLFLHTKSGANTKSYKLRKKQFEHVFNLKKTLDKLEPESASSGDARYIVVGDLNTMGNGPRGMPKRISGSKEVDLLARKAREKGMKMEVKEHENTFHRRKKGREKKLTSNLDHVLTSESVNLKAFPGRNYQNKPFTVRVVGWNQLLDNTPALHEFEDKLSDHSALYFEVKTPIDNAHGG